MIHVARLYYRYLPVAVTGLLLCFACKEQEVPLGVGNARLAGTWLLYQRSFGPDTNVIRTPIPATQPQTITFSGDGNVTVSGDSLSYYRNVKYYRVDSTTGVLQLRLIANVQELPGEPQGLLIRRDTLVLTPYFSPSLQLAFVRMR